jgi:O-antigen chain-terminating methyltransferase
MLLREARRRLPDKFDRAQTEAIAAVEDPFLASFYTRFEDRFRGSRDEVRSRFRVYLPEIEDLAAGGRELRIVDLGCGRGEWLELLRDSHLRAIGVDTNDVQLADARALGLTVERADALAYLEGQPDASIDVITSMHLVEHLPFPTLMALLREMARTLRPAGRIIVETPNPESVVVGAYKFHLDPTHTRPLPPELLATLVEFVGFVDVRTVRLHPDPRLERLAAGGFDREAAEVLFGPRDYAVIASRPD